MLKSDNSITSNTPIYSIETIKKIKSIATDFRKGILDSKSSKQECFKVSAALVGYLSFCGYTCELIEGKVGKWGHCWIVLEHNMILDTTADQFKKPDGKPMPKVYVGEKPNWYKIANK